MFSVIWLMLTLSAIVWQNYVFDPALMTNAYESPPGTLLCVGRACTALWFTHAVFTTMRRRTAASRRAFYKRFCLIYTAYILVVPAYVLFASFSVGSLQRRLGYFCCQQFSIVIALGLLSLLWAPAYVDRNFPVLGTDRMRVLASQRTGRLRGAAAAVGRGGRSSSSSSIDVDSEQAQRKMELHKALKMTNALKYKLLALHDVAEDMGRLAPTVQAAAAASRARSPGMRRRWERFAVTGAHGAAVHTGVEMTARR